MEVLICCVLLYGCERQTGDKQTVLVANKDMELSEPSSPEPEGDKQTVLVANKDMELSEPSSPEPKIVPQITGGTGSSRLAFSNPDFPEWETSEWSTINPSTDEFPILFALNGLYGYLDSQLCVIVPPIYDRGYIYNDQGYTWVRYKGRGNIFECMVLNWKGNAVFHAYTADLDILYDDIICYTTRLENQSRVERIRDSTIITDMRGPASSSEDGILLLFNGGDRAFIDSFSGRRLLPDLDMVKITNGFWEGRAVISAIIDGSRDMHIIDVNGKFYDKLNLFRAGRYFSEGLLPAETKERVTGYINMEGEFVFIVPIVAERHDDDWSPLFATDFKGGYALIQTSLEPPVWRVINNMGEYVSDELSISEAYAFADGLSCIRTTGKIDSKYGYINTKGETVIEPVFDSAESFVRGYARIVYQGRDGLINTEGEIFWSDELVKAQTTTQH